MRLLVPPPIVGLICGALMWFAAGRLPMLSFDFPLRVEVALLLCTFSAAVDLSSIVRFFQEKTTINPLSPESTEQLVTTGMYRFTRNPMYLGMAGLLLSFGLWLGSLAMVPCVILFVWFITVFQIKPEEEVLREKFGAEYEQYAVQVRRWL